MDLQASSSLERRFRSEEGEGRQAHRTTVGREDDRAVAEEAVQVDGLSRLGFVAEQADLAFTFTGVG